MSNVQEAPVLETERLKLRPHCIGDFDPCAAMWSDVDVTRYIGGRPFSPEETWARLLRYAGHWSWLGFGFWAVEEKATGRFVGELGFADFKREIEPSLAGIPELGWVLATGAHGKGYATEAVRTAIAWGDAFFGPARTICLIHPQNAKSIRVAGKCGYRECGTATYKSQPVCLFDRRP